MTEPSHSNSVITKINKKKINHTDSYALLIAIERNFIFFQLILINENKNNYADKYIWEYGCLSAFVRISQNREFFF